MSLHTIEFDYDITEPSTLTMDLDPSLDPSEKEDLALDEIKDLYPDVSNINISKISEVK